MEINNDNGNYKSEQMTSIRHVTGIPRIIIKTFNLRSTMPRIDNWRDDAERLIAKRIDEGDICRRLKDSKEDYLNRIGDQWTHLKDA